MGVRAEVGRRACHRLHSGRHHAVDVAQRSRRQHQLPRGARTTGTRPVARARAGRRAPGARTSGADPALAAFRNGCTFATRPRCGASPDGCRSSITSSTCFASTTARSCSCRKPRAPRPARGPRAGPDDVAGAAQLPRACRGYVMAASAQHGLEGIVARRQASTYRPGQQSPDGRKVNTNGCRQSSSPPNGSATAVELIWATRAV